MPIKKIKGAGTILQANISGAFTPLGQRVNIDGPSIAVGVKDVSDLDSVANEKRGTIPDNGDVSMQVFFDPNDPTHAVFQDWAAVPNPDGNEFKIIFNCTPTKSVAFTAVVSAFKIGGMTYDGYLTADITLAVSGVLTWA